MTSTEACFYRQTVKCPKAGISSFTVNNMNSGAMFGNLDLYAGEDYYNAHRFAYLQTEDGIQEYKIVTVLKADRNLFPVPAETSRCGGSAGVLKSS